MDKEVFHLQKTLLSVNGTSTKPFEDFFQKQLLSGQTTAFLSLGKSMSPSNSNSLEPSTSKTKRDKD